MINGKRIAVVLPAYNAAKTLEQTVREIPELVDNVILVDDHSSDATAALANSSTTLTSPRKAKPRRRYNFPWLQAHICVDSTPAIS